MRASLGKGITENPLTRILTAFASGQLQGVNAILQGKAGGAFVGNYLAAAQIQKELTPQAPNLRPYVEPDPNQSQAAAFLARFPREVARYDQDGAQSMVPG